MPNFKFKPLRFIGTLAAGAYFYYCVNNPTLNHVVDALDLVIHEAGHFVFIIFGQFANVLGGSFLQIIVPAIFCLYFFLFRWEYFSGSILMLWLGYSIVNVSIYLADAITMNMPLLGGDNVIHDWNYLLSHSGLLAYTQIISNSVYILGIMIMTAGFVFSLIFSVSKRKEAVSA